MNIQLNCVFLDTFQRLDIQNETIELVHSNPTETHELPRRVPKDTPRYHFFLYKHSHEGDDLESVGTHLMPVVHNCTMLCVFLTSDRWRIIIPCHQQQYYFTQLTNMCQRSAAELHGNKKSQSFVSCSKLCCAKHNSENESFVMSQSVVIHC